MANKQKQLPKSRVSELHFEIAHKVDIALKIHQPTKLSFYVLSQLRMIIEYRYDYNERKKVCNTVLKMQVPPPPQPDQSWSYLSFIKIQPSTVC